MPSSPERSVARETDESRYWVATSERIGLLTARYVHQVFPRHAHDTYVVCVNEQGGHLSWYRGRTVTIHEREIAVIPPGEVHTGQPIRNRVWRYRALYPSTELFRALASEAGLRSAELPYFTSLSIENPFLADALVRVHRLCEYPADSLSAEAELIDVLSMLVRLHAAGTRLTRMRNLPCHPVHRALDCIRECFAERVTLQMLAGITGLPRATMLRAFRREVGLPPYVFLTQVRIEHAKRFLQEGVAIAEVAQRVGFADQSHLTRHFKRLVGVTPGVFARGTTHPS